ncbi:phosphoribosylformylglycinamidine cyclo-ligase [Candidatus Gracilibacteria bacterium]|nr:phosphoribosylformylglycinamidine cyclo-ligase [Candidatus Gracilibacteria bacterium]
MSDYNDRGVSSDKSEVHTAIKLLDKGIFPNAFCKILPDLLGGDEKFCNITHADGAGTKAILAYLYWKETGDLSVFKGVAQDSIVMNLDDLACIGAINVPLLLSSSIGRNKFLVPGEVIAEIINGTEEFLQTLRELGIQIHYGGGETADLGDSIKTLVIDHTLTTRMTRHDVVLPQILPGNIIVGLASFGQASYETEYNSGIGSNGLTSARHDVLDHKYAERYPEITDPNMPKHLVYRGDFDLKELAPRVFGNEVEFENTSIGKLLLSPTRTYAPIIKRILDTIHWSTLKGIIHCSGGGQTKVMKFADNVHIIKNNLFPTPPLFQLLQAEARTDWKEMFQTYNMGHRMELYTNSQQTAEQIIEISKSFNVNAQIIGHVEKFNGKKLTILHNDNEIIY